MRQSGSMASFVQTLFGFTGGLSGAAADRVVSTATRTDLDALKKKYVADNPESGVSLESYTTITPPLPLFCWMFVVLE